MGIKIALETQTLIWSTFMIQLTFSPVNAATSNGP